MKQPTGLKAVGIVEHPETKYWQVWITTTGEKLTWLAAFRQSGAANEIVKIVQKEAQQGGLTQQEVVVALFGFLNRRTEAKPQNLPAEQEADCLEKSGA